MEKQHDLPHSNSSHEWHVIDGTQREIHTCMKHPTLHFYLHTRKCGIT